MNLPGEPGGGGADVDGFVDEYRGLATQLQGYRGQVLGRGRHDDPSHAAVTRVEDVIKALFKQYRRFRYGSLHDGDGACQVVGDPACQCGRACRCQFAGLGDDDVAGCERADDGCQEELEGIVPGGYDKDYPERVQHG